VNPSSQTPGVTRGCDLRGAENRGRSTCYASYVDEPVMMVSGVGTKHYFHQNHLYSVAAMTSSTGAVVERYRYDAYGKRTVTNAAGTPIAASTIGQQRGFTGYYLDAETGLYYARARMYSAGLGRFVGRDPWGKSSDDSYLLPKKYENEDGEIIYGPTAGDGYPNGYNLYAAYFTPNHTDSSGMAIPGPGAGAFPNLIRLPYVCSTIANHCFGWCDCRFPAGGKLKKVAWLAAMTVAIEPCCFSSCLHCDGGIARQPGAMTACMQIILRKVFGPLVTCGCV